MSTVYMVFVAFALYGAIGAMRRLNKPQYNQVWAWIVVLSGTVGAGVALGAMMR